jgi:hypothetical protein
LSPLQGVYLVGMLPMVVLELPGIELVPNVKRNIHPSFKKRPAVIARMKISRLKSIIVAVIQYSAFAALLQKILQFGHISICISIYPPFPDFIYLQRLVGQKQHQIDFFAGKKAVDPGFDKQWDAASPPQSLSFIRRKLHDESIAENPAQGAGLYRVGLNISQTYRFILLPHIFQ